MNKLARRKNIQKIIEIPSHENSEVEFIIENIIYTTEFDSYSLPQEVFGYLCSIDFDKMKSRIQTHYSYSQEEWWPGVSYPPKTSESYFSEGGVLLATNTAPLQGCNGTEGYKLYLFHDKMPMPLNDPYRLQPLKRMGLFWFQEQEGCVGSSCFRETFWKSYYAKLEKIVEINRLGVCIPVKQL